MKILKERPDLEEQTFECKNCETMWVDTRKEYRQIKKTIYRKSNKKANFWKSLTIDSFEDEFIVWVVESKCPYCKKIIEKEILNTDKFIKTTTNYKEIT